MKRLFILSAATGYGGAERSIELVARHLPAGIEVTIFAHNAEHIARLAQPGAMAPGARLIRLGRIDTLAGKRRAALRLTLEYLRHRPDAVLVNSHASALLAAMAAKFVTAFGTRCHLYVRDFLWDDLEYIFGRLAGARVLVPSAAVSARCGYLHPLFVEPFGAASCDVIPDMTEIPSGPVRYEGPLLHLATMNPWKGHADLAMAMRHLKERGQPVLMRSHGMTGNAALRDRLLRLIDRLDISDRFTLADYAPDVSRLLRGCRAVVIASVSHSGGPETFGRTIIEAWAHRKPVIAYAAGAPAQLIEHDRNGLLVPEGDTEALADALHRLASSVELCRRLGEAGYEKVVRGYEAGDVTKLLLKRMGLVGDGAT